MTETRQILISVHVPKTGGTSFRHVLETRFGTGLLIDHPWERLPDPLNGERLRGSDDEIRRALRGITCIHGHFNVRKYLPLLEVEGIEPLFMTWLRDPVERAVSTYFFLRGNLGSPMRHSDWERRARDLTMEQFFADGDYGRDRQYGQLSGLPMDRYAFLGRTERYAESLQVFSHVFVGGRAMPRAPHRRRNKQRRGERYEIPTELRRQLEESNAQDAGICQYADRWLDDALAAIRSGDPAAGPAQFDLSGARQVFPLLRRKLQRVGRRLF